jgi:protein phosphatase
VQVDIEGPHPLEPGDIFLLCSDGLSGQVNDRVIGAVATALPPPEAVRFLVHMANLQGGPDNTTVIVVRVGGEPRLAGIDSQAEVVFPASESKDPVVVPRLAVLTYHLGRLPWAFIMLVSGILLGPLSFLLYWMDMIVGSLTVFILAALAILSGIMSLMFEQLREMRVVKQPEERVLQVYRQTACPLDMATYEKLVQSAKALEDGIKEKNWEYDVKAYQDKVKLAATLHKQQHVLDACREQCRAMMVLMDAVHRYRRKNEDFKPMW